MRIDESWAGLLARRAPLRSVLAGQAGRLRSVLAGEAGRLRSVLAGEAGRLRSVPAGAAGRLRSVLAGAAGTAAMTGTYALERWLRSKRGPLDYDDSLVPGQIVASIMHLPAVTAREDRDLGLALRWGYGSAFGIWHGALRRRLPEPWASALFGATLMSATLSLFPLLGRTPPPWRWPPDVMATCLGTHLVYLVTVATVDDALRTAG